MSRRGSRSPDISAIEDRAISQSEKMARIRAEMAEEARERMERLALAQSSETVVQRLARSHGGNFEAEAERVSRRSRHLDDIENLKVMRDPCPRCGVRADMHAEFGCNRWRPR